MTYTLYYKETCNETLACLAALELAGLEVSLSKVDQKTLHSKDFKSFNPASLTPCLVGKKQVVSAAAILRFAGAQKESLYGSSSLEKALVDQYVEYALNQIQPEIQSILKSIYGVQVIDMRILEKKIQETVEELSFLDKYVKGKNFLCNEKLSLADIVLVSVLESFLRFACSAKQRNSIKNLFNYVALLVKQPELKGYFLELDSLKETVFGYYKVDVVLQEKLKAEEKRLREEEEAKEKALAQAMEKEEQEMMKEPVFPESKVIFDEWKNVVCQEKDLEKKLQYVKDNHDPKGYSFWKLDYDKLPNSMKEELPSSNFFINFVNRCDVFRKFVYAVHALVHKDSDYNMRGLWYMRGEDKLPNLALNQDMEYYFFKKLDPNTPEDWEEIKAFLSLTRESEGRDRIAGELVVQQTLIC